MRKVILQEWLTLDGYAVDSNGNIDFVTSTEFNKNSDEDVLQFMETVDTILLGAITYKLFVDFWPTATTDVEIIADQLNSTPKTVFSTSLTKAPWGKWPEATIIRTDACDAIRQLKVQPGKNMVLWGSISLAQSLIKANLIDQYHLRICPVTVGGGRLLFPVDNHSRNFSLIEFKKYASGLISLQYEIKI